jgi:hypothetical protein
MERKKVERRAVVCLFVGLVVGLVGLLVGLLVGTDGDVLLSLAA